MQKEYSKKYIPNESNQIKRRSINEINLKKRYSPLTHVSFVHIFSIKTIDFIKGFNEVVAILCAHNFKLLRMNSK
jgi:hypothetical protein